ncbi:MAG: ATPase [Rhodobacterales bacterium 34-62-10]|nr:MAG: ATPase [Rhodobacterales bacterium 34-62-10]
MSEWKAKRFWTTASVVPVDGGFTVHLDSRAVKTPAKTPLIVPTRAMAAAIAAEWDAQEGQIDPRTMPVTRSANAAIDKVAVQHPEVAQMIADYGDSDLLCYRAPGPVELIERQAQMWDPLLDWAEATLGVRLSTATGVVHVPQDHRHLGELSARVHALGFAVLMDHRSADEIWHLSRLDEEWQIEQWGADDEAEAMAETKRLAFLHAKFFLDLARSPN